MCLWIWDCSHTLELFFLKRDKCGEHIITAVCCLILQHCHCIYWPSHDTITKIFTSFRQTGNIFLLLYKNLKSKPHSVSVCFSSCFFSLTGLFLSFFSLSCLIALTITPSDLFLAQAKTHFCLSLLCLALIKTRLKSALTISLPLLCSCLLFDEVIPLTFCLSFSFFLGLWPCPDVQFVYAPLLVDGEWPRVQSDTHHPSSFLGTWGPSIYIYIWLSGGFSVHRGGSLLTADTPGSKYFS